MAKLKKETTIDNINILDYFYPIGTVYQTFDNTFDPNTTWGGTWEKIVNKFLYGGDTSGITGGEASHELTINEMPSHSHTVKRSDGCYLTSWVTNASSGSLWSCACDDSKNEHKEYVAESVGGGSTQQYASVYYNQYLAQNCLVILKGLLLSLNNILSKGVN